MVDLRLRDSVDQARYERHKGREKPEPPPQWTRRALHHLVPAEAAIPVERTGDAAAVATLVKLQAAVRAARLLGMVEHHGRLITARTETGSDKCQGWELHISVITGMTIGRRRVWRQTVLETASWIASFSRLTSACVSANRPIL